jgi:hypothetical protein
MTAPAPLTGHRVSLPPGTYKPYPCLCSTEAKRSVQAERSREGRFLPRLRQSNTHARRRRPNIAQRPDRAPRRRGVRGSLPTTTQQSKPTRRREPSATARPSAAGMGVRVPPPTTGIQIARTPNKAKPSAAARSSAAEKGLPRLRQSSSHARRRRPSRAQRPGRAQR